MQEVEIIRERAVHSFTFQYAQPSEYHFCQDSILLAEFVARQIKNENVFEGFRALDLCAGCGVIGFELAYHLPNVQHVDFVEVQSLFEPYFQSNKEITGKRQFRFLNQNYESLLNESGGQYDLIVANPPYFSKNNGKLSGKPVQDRARFFLDSSFEKLLEAVVYLLKAKGTAFVLAKADDGTGRDLLRSTQLTLLGQAKVSIAADIRGTKVLRLQR